MICPQDIDDEIDVDDIDDEDEIGANGDGDGDDELEDGGVNGGGRSKSFYGRHSER